jgi:nucleoside 2-deoxyribosyltransferase
MKIYIASRLENFLQVQAVRDALAAAGHTITYDWTLHGSVKDDGEARLREVALLELNGVRDADLVVVLLPGGRGTHAELGAANILGKPVILFSDKPHPLLSTDATCAFYWNENVYQLHTPGKAPEDIIPGVIENALKVDWWDAFLQQAPK